MALPLGELRLAWSKTAVYNMANYDWHPDAKKGGSVFKVETRNLGWWIFLAVLVSVGIHILLYFILSSWERPAKQTEDLLNFRVSTDRETIDRSKLEELLKQSEPNFQNSNETPEHSKIDVDQDLDFPDLMEILESEPIRIAPADAPEIFAAALPKIPRQALDMTASALEISSAETLSADLKEMRQKLTESSRQIAPEQVVINLSANENDSKGVNTDDFFKNAADKAMGQEADEFIKGYTSLDDLVSKGIKPGANKTALLPTDILFEFGEANLLEGSQLAMIKLAFLIDTNPEAIFIIEGHTDTIGSDEANLDLSLRRAKSVKDWLVDRLRIDPRNIRIIGKGEREPIVPSDGTPDQQELNRRVEIVIRRPK